jgi:uncharacterized protein
MGPALRGRVGLRWPAFLIMALVACGIASANARAADPKFPALTGRVVDDAALLSPAARERITGWLAQFELATKRQVVVVTVPSLQAYPIEDFGYRLGRAWGIGEKGKNTGAILLVAPNERAVRIEVGYGLEGELTDAISRAIIERDILPAFRQGQYEQGITAGTAAILRALGWNGATIATETRSEEPPGGFVIFLIIMAVIFFAALRHGRHGIWLVPMMGKDVWGSRSRGGGFSGGGGSFGGGGASGRW